MSYNILVVDDSPIIRSMIKKAITMSGLQAGKVLEAANGREALALLASEWIDIVFADIHMPEMDGLELVEHMSRDNVLLSLPVVIVSSDSNPQLLDDLKRRGIRAFIKKPFGPEELRDVVHQILGGMTGSGGGKL